MKSIPTRSEDLHSIRPNVAPLFHAENRGDSYARSSFSSQATNYGLPIGIDLIVKRQSFLRFLKLADRPLNTVLDEYRRKHCADPVRSTFKLYNIQSVVKLGGPNTTVTKIRTKTLIRCSASLQRLYYKQYQDSIIRCRRIPRVWFFETPLNYRPVGVVQCSHLTSRLDSDR